MANRDIPTDAPPPYPGRSGLSPPRSNRLSNPVDPGHLAVPHRPDSPTGSTASSIDTASAEDAGYNDAVPGQARASLEDQARGLPEGWVRRFDASYGHHFYVDTRSDPPKSIWTHPYDELEYRDSAPADDIGRKYRKKQDRKAAKADAAGSSSHPTASAAASSSSSRPPRDPTAFAPSGTPSNKKPADGEAAAATATTAEEKRTFGRKLKDKMTSSTHGERVAKRQAQAEQDRIAYEKYRQVQAAFQEANRTGRPVLIGRDKTGRDVYAEPDYDPYAGRAYGPGGGYGAPYGPYGRRGYGYGGGYGGGGMGMGAPLLGGLLLGGLLGAAAF